MAWLFIDTHSPEGSRYAWLEAGRPVKPAVVAGRSNRLLARLAKDWKAHKLEGVCVVVGPGRFTAVRTGVLYANLRAPIVINPQRMIGRQVLPDEGLYPIRHALTTKA